MHSGTFSSFVVLFFALRAKKRTTDEIGSTMLPQAKWRFSAQSCKSNQIAESISPLP
jgi:hypothetical protein